MTKSEKGLSLIFAAQSLEAARNTIRALKADKEGRPTEALLFRALATGQQVHADKALMLMRGIIGNTDANMAAATAATSTMIDDCRGQLMTAATEGARSIESALTHFTKASMSHRSMAEKNNHDAIYHVCSICGYMAGKTIPQRCPVCRAVPQQFDRVE